MRYAGAGWEGAADHRLAGALYAWGRRRPAVAVAARSLSYAGEHAALWIGAGLVAAAADRARRSPWLRATALTATAHVAAMSLKPLVRRPRPAPVPGLPGGGPAPAGEASAPAGPAPVAGSCSCAASAPGVLAPVADPAAVGGSNPAGDARPVGGAYVMEGLSPAGGPALGGGRAPVAGPCACAASLPGGGRRPGAGTRAAGRAARVFRPVVGRYSFPSSHAASAAAAAVAFGAVRPGARWVGVPVAAAMCVSRLVLGVHYPTDVAAGALLGAVTARRLHQAATNRFCAHPGTRRG